MYEYKTGTHFAQPVFLFHIVAFFSFWHESGCCAVLIINTVNTCQVCTKSQICACFTDILLP